MGSSQRGAPFARRPGTVPGRGRPDRRLGREMGYYALTYTQSQRLLPDTDLIEYICNENFQSPLKTVGK